MGWAYCGEDSKGREIGYGVEAVCDHPDCDVIIDRGMSYACGDTHGAGDDTVDYMYCENYFCSAHLQMGHEVQQCMSCYKMEEAFYELEEALGNE